MKTRKRILSIVLTIATLLLLVLDIPVTAAGTKKVDVLFTHDTHSHLLHYLHLPVPTRSLLMQNESACLLVICQNASRAMYGISQIGRAHV